MRNHTRLYPKKVKEIVVIQENTEKVAAFLQKTTYEVKKTGTNIFACIDIKEIVRRQVRTVMMGLMPLTASQMMLMVTSTKAMISPILKMMWSRKWPEYLYSLSQQ